jgi:hypothetical protein
MKENEDKYLEKLVDTIMKDSKLEKPSLDFTAKVMSQVLTSKKSEVYVYKPLISKYVFILFFGCLLTLCFYLKPQTDNSINRLSESLFYNFNRLLLFSFSKITVYSVCITSLLLLIQISFLRKHFENQIEK